MKYMLNRLALTLGLVFSFSAAFAALEFTISAPNGVGDVVALTNAIFRINQSNNTGTKVLLEPGVYDLTGIRSSYGSGTLLNGAHLYFNTTCKNALIAGLGDGPEDVVLKGDGTLGIFHIWTTDVNNPTVVSNLTVTGGRRKGDGGGIYGSAGLILKNLIVTNNYATGLAGGVLRARMYNCLIADNHSTGNHGGGFWSDSAGTGADTCVFSNNTTTANGGGFYSSGAGGFLIGCEFYNNSGDNGSGACIGKGFVTNCLFKGNGPTVAVNSDKLGGGIYLASSCECVDCEFIENHADSGGGAYIASNTTEVRDCLFEKNRQAGWASGAAVFVSAASPLALISNCVFNANFSQQSSRTIISNAELVDCIITNHSVQGYVLAGCNMTRCYLAHNMSTANGQNLDIATAYGLSAVSRTNVNCVIAFNNTKDGAHAITEGKTVVNCTYYGNVSTSGSGGMVRDGAAFNTLFVGNSIGGVLTDVKGRQYLTNCVFSASSIAVDADGLFNCRLAPNFKFYPTEDGGEYDIKSSSPAFNAGMLEDWMVPLLGGKDFAGRERIKYDTIDIGALECQYRPFFGIVVR